MESNRLARNLKRAHMQIQNFKDPEIVFSFPQDIITEIFARLPVKSLLRFRCGSKSWCCLISSKSFVKKHLDYSTKNTNLTNHCVIATYTRPHHSLRQYSLSSLLYEPSSDAVDNEYPVSDSNRNVCVVGCCNGLVCIKSSKDLILWNLLTREFKKLPETDLMIRMGGSYITKYGFGYDEGTDDYKVLGVVSMCRTEGRYEAISKIYSLKTNSWKRIEHFKVEASFEGQGLFASGRLHWGKHVGMDYGFNITSFDMENEVNEKVELLKHVEAKSYPSVRVLGGCLCLICMYHPPRMDIWVLKEYGVNDSWYKLANIPQLDAYSRITPVFVASEGEILFLCGTTFIVYDPKRKVLKRLR